MALGIRGFNPIWAEFDLTGKIFDDTYWLFVLENTLPYIPATVYHDPDLNVPWTNPIQFLANGTLPNDIYFETDHVYRLEFRQGDTQADPLIYEVNNYIPGSGGSTPVDTVAFASSNQITNPQFSLINFVSPYTLGATDPDPVQIAPGWFLELAGTGTAVISRVALDNANTNPSNAPYALRLTLTGWTTDSIFLVQRFQQNGMLWANKIVSSTVTARLEGAPQSISATLVDSNSSTLTTVLPLTTVNESWNEFTGYGELPATTNPDDPPAAYIEYKMALPNNVDIYLTSFQLVVQELPIEPSFEQDSIERQVDHTFHYYKPQLELKPIPSYTLGWDFAYNPCQELGTTITVSGLGNNKSRYIADQTIAFEAVGNTMTYGVANTSGLTASTGSATQFAFIQYLDPTTAIELLQGNMAVCINASTSVALNGYVNLYYTTDGSLPNVAPGTNNSLIATMVGGKPATFNGNWTKVNRSNLGDALFVVDSTADPIIFSGWNGVGQSGATSATFFAIVVSFAEMPSTQSLSMRFATLSKGDIATPPPPLNKAETLAALQYYYETTYPSFGTAASGANSTNIRVVPCAMSLQINGSGNVTTYGITANSFNLQWNSLKRAVPNISFNSQAGTAATLSLTYILNGATTGPADVALASFWQLITNGTKGAYYRVISTTYMASFAANLLSSFVGFNYTADSRLGIV